MYALGLDEPGAVRLLQTCMLDLDGLEQKDGLFSVCKRCSLLSIVVIRNP